MRPGHNPAGQGLPTHSVAPIIRRMINNSRAGGLAVIIGTCCALGCSGDGASANDFEPASGVVEFDERTLAFEVGGRVRDVRVDKGDEIAPGAFIAALDDSLERPVRDARAAEARAAAAQVALLRAGSRRQDVSGTAAQVRALRANEDLVRRNLERQRALASHGASAPAAVDDLQSQLARVSNERAALGQRLSLLRSGARSEEVDTAEARLASAQAALAAAEERVARYVLRGPIAGSVLDVYVEPGEVVAPGAPVATLADIQHPYVDVFVPQADLAGIRVGTRATARIDAERTSFAGRVEHLGDRTEFTPRFLFSERERPNLVVRVRVRLEDPHKRIHAGVPAFVRFARARQP